MLLLSAAPAPAQAPRLKPLHEIIPPEQQLPGLWEGTTPSGLKEYMTFHAGGTVIMIGPGGQRAVHQWKCDTSTRPWSMDLTVEGQQGKATIFTCFDFPAADTFRMAAPALDIKKRPGAEALRASTMVMKRVPWLPNAGLHQVVQAHLKGLAGTWHSSKAGENGTITFKPGGTYVIEAEGEKESGRFRIDVTRVPCTIDMLKDDGTPPVFAIFEIKDGRLRLGRTKPSEKERVKDFAGADELVRKK
jgi:hypothetical protein